MLATKVICPHCSRRLKLPQGENPRVRCPYCQAPFAVPGTAPVKAAPAPTPVLRALPFAPPPLAAAAPVASPPVPPTLPRRNRVLWWIVGGVGAIVLVALGLVLQELWVERPGGTNRPASTPEADSAAGASAVVTLPTTPRAPQPRELTPEEKRVNAAIDRGIAFLRKQQTDSGTWVPYGHPVGMAALPALTLLECGVSPEDPQVQKAAAFVRKAIPKLNKTYELALAILFLDRLGESQDRPRIKTLAARLIAGQTRAGGWTYDCPLLSTEYEQLLTEALQELPPLPRLEGVDERGTKPTEAGRKPQEGTSTPKESPAPGKIDLARLPQMIRNFPVMRPPESKQEMSRHDNSDNSNTQFGILGIWAARRHGVPVGRTLALIERRFRASQNQQGTWGYNFSIGGGGGTPAMICAGLLGLAVGYARDEGTERGHPPGQDVTSDPAIQRALKALSAEIGSPDPNSNPPANALNLYFLWSVERVGMLYDLERIGEKDWYSWGSRLLVATQSAEGSWHGQGHGASPLVDTSLALLFLRRVNFTYDVPTKFRLNAER